MRKILLLLFTVLLCTTLISSFDWDDESLVSYWQLNESSGAVIDEKGLNNGSNVGATAGVTGKINNAYDFENSSSQYVSLYNNQSLNITNNVTVNTWIKLESLPNTGAYFGVLGKQADGAARASYALDVVDNGTVRFISYRVGGDTNAVVGYSSTVLSVGTWYMLTGIANSTGNFLFINGNLEVSALNTNNILYGAFNFTLGRRFTDNYFDGVIDEVGLWNSSLSQSDINILYNFGDGLPYGELPNYTAEYPSNSYETATMTNGYFLLNATNISYIDVNATLNYNGTTFSPTKSTSDGFFIFEQNITKTFTNTTDIDYYWNLTVLNSSGSYTLFPYNSTQVINPIIFTLCNATYTTKYINFTFKDESDLSVINATIPQATFVYWLGDGSVNKTYNFVNNTANYDYAFCFSPNTENLTVDSYIQYTSSDYPQRLYNPSAMNFTSTVTNTTLYLLNTDDGIYVTFQVINSAEQTLSGVSVSATRTIESSDVVVGIGTTDDAGSVTFWLNPNFQHTFNFSKSGFEDFVSTFTPSQTSYTITLSGGEGVSESYYKGITYLTLPTNSSLTNDTDYTFGFQLNSSFWDVTDFGFNLRLSNGTIITGGNSGIEGTLLTLVYNTTNQTRIYLDYYWLINGTYINSSTYWNVYNTLNTQWSISRFFTDLNSYIDSGLFGLDDFGKKVIVFLVLFITIGTLSYKYGVQDPIFISALIFGVIYFFDFTIGLLPSYVNVAGVEIPHLYTFIAGLLLVTMIIRGVAR